MPDGASAPPGTAGAPRLDRLGQPGVPPVVLASGSAVRARLLADVGLRVARDVAAVDEAEIKASLRADGIGAAEVAEALAELKAVKVSRRHAGALVIGCDQMLDCEGVWFDKPETMAAARAQLLRLAGRQHRLLTAVVVVRDGVRLWHHGAVASLTMRPFGEAFIDAYQLEGPGAQLFAGISGDYFSILGLPLLPLLGFLRQHRVVPE